jgi:hypothetical protein
MRTPRLRTVAGILCWIVALSSAGCRPEQPAPGELKTPAERADGTNEARGVADASLGKQAEVLAHGNLAQNGREQILVVNRFSAAAQVSTGAPASKEQQNTSAVFVTRAAVLEKNGGKWSEILLCDEHLKNPNGYLGGSPAERVTGWRLEYRQDAKEGLQMKFTPAEGFDAINVNAEQSSEPKVPTFDVRWNTIAKRYQTFDQSHERYLSEVPSLETPQSILK